MTPIKQLQRISHSSRSLLGFTVCFLTFFLIQGSLYHLSAAGTYTIRVFESPELQSDRIRLGEIAEIKGEDPAFLEKLREIVIGKSPLPGKSRRIDSDYIRIHLKRNEIDLSQISLQVPKKVEVSRSSIAIPKKKIEKIISDYVYRIVPWERDKVRIKKVCVSNNVVLPVGNIAYSIVPPKNMDLLGTISLPIIFKVNNHFQKKVWATVSIEVLEEIVVTKRSLRRHQMITEDDIHLKKMDLSKIKSNAVTTYEAVLGKRTKRAINTGEALRTEHIELPPLVKRGDVVSIIAESDGLRITALGEVRKKGCRGERIKVLNLDSKKCIYAHVLDSNTVRVDF
jgi:flagella basal body P-ring formation protein FlgA